MLLTITDAGRMSTVVRMIYRGLQHFAMYSSIDVWNSTYKMIYRETDERGDRQCLLVYCQVYRIKPPTSNLQLEFELIARAVHITTNSHSLNFFSPITESKVLPMASPNCGCDITTLAFNPTVNLVPIQSRLPRRPSC